MLVPALIVVGESRYAARVLNLSSTGALLGSIAQFEAGTLVTFTCGTIKTAATVVRQASGVLGVAFHTELDWDDIRRQVDRTAAMQTRPRYIEGSRYG